MLFLFGSFWSRFFSIIWQIDESKHLGSFFVTSVKRWHVFFFLRDEEFNFYQQIHVMFWHKHNLLRELVFPALGSWMNIVNHFKSFLDSRRSKRKQCCKNAEVCLRRTASHFSFSQITSCHVDLQYVAPAVAVWGSLYGVYSLHCPNCWLQLERCR